MSSLLRSKPDLKEGITKFLKPQTPCYLDLNISFNRPFPFTYYNGVLDISLENNRFQEQMINQTGREPNSQSYTAVKIMGGPKLVTALGENFKTYVRAWKSGVIDAGSPIELYQPSQILRVQEGDINFVNADSEEVFLESTTPPTSDEFECMSLAPCGTYIFKTPLVFTTIESGVKKYITFFTTLDQE